MLFRIMDRFGRSYILGNGESVNRLYRRLTGKNLWNEEDIPQVALITKYDWCGWRLEDTLTIVNLMLESPYGRYYTRALEHAKPKTSSMLLSEAVFERLPYSKKRESFYNRAFSGEDIFSGLYDRWYQNKKQALQGVPFEER